MAGFTLTLLILRELAFIAAGWALCHMAYRLFMAGVDAGGAEEMTLGKYMKLKGGGPGIVFVALGSAIIVYSIYSAGRLEPDELQMLLAADQECVCDETSNEGH